MKIVESSGLSWPAVNAVIKQGSDLAIKPTQRGRKLGKGRVLSKEQELELRNIICRKRPWQVGIKRQFGSLRLSLWCRDAVTCLIELKYGIKISERGLAKYLVRWGLSPPELMSSPYDRCPKDIKKWLDDNYTLFVQRAKAEDAEICWVSKTNVVNTDEWPAYEKNGKQLSLSMITAINSKGKIRWQIVTGAFTQKLQIIFLKAMRSESRKKIFMLRNNLKHYANKDVTIWLALNDIELFPGVGCISQPKPNERSVT